MTRRRHVTRRPTVSILGSHVLLSSEKGEKDATLQLAAEYRRFVEHGIKQPPDSPFEQARHGRILGSRAYAKRLRSLLAERPGQKDPLRDHQLPGAAVALVWQATAAHYGLDQEALGQRGRHPEMRAVAAWLAKRHTPATLRELAEPLELGHPQSVVNLPRRAGLAVRASRKLHRTIEAIEARIAVQFSKTTETPRRSRRKK